MTSRSALDAIILDVDGTLVDSNDAHARAWQQAFARQGKHIEYDVIRSQIGKGGDLLVPDLLNAREMRKIGQAVREGHDEIYRGTEIRTVRPFDGAAESLRAFHDRGIRLVVGTSADPSEVEGLLREMGVEDLLDGKTTSDDAQYSKPSPEIFEAALKKVKARPERSLVIADTPYDILAAHRLAIPIAAVLCGGFPEDSLRKAEFLFRDVADIARRFEEIERYFDE